VHILIDANMPRTAATLLASYGHVSTDVRDTGMGRAADADIARYAKDHALCILTGDWGFADIRTFPPPDYCGVVIIGLPDRAMPADILNALRSLPEMPDIMSLLPGRLAIVERHKIRLRHSP
jgi:predicted nuclease of predicted toxin-antitoxin system